MFEINKLITCIRCGTELIGSISKQCPKCEMLYKEYIEVEQDKTFRVTSITFLVKVKDYSIPKWTLN